MGFFVLMSALLALSHAAAPPSDPERCRAAVSEAQALLAAVEADPDSYENVEETRASLRRTIAEARCAAPTASEADRSAVSSIDHPAPRHEAGNARLRPVPGDAARVPSSPLKTVPIDRRSGFPTGAVPMAAGLLLALGGLVWNMRGRTAAETAWRDFKRSMAVGAMLLGIVVASYGGYLLYGAISATPGLALTGGGALAPAVAVDGAMLVEGAAAIAAGAKSASEGYNYAKSQGKLGRPTGPQGAPLGQGASSSVKGPSAKDLELQRLIDQLFKPRDRLPGGTAGAVRHETTTGQLLSRSGHAKKAEERINQLNRILKRSDLDSADRATAEALRADLRNALDAAGGVNHP